MATKYASQQQGVADGTKNPPDKADGRVVNGRRSCIIASKLAGTDAWANGDVVYLGRKRKGEKITNILINAGTSLGSSTVAIGVGGDPRAGGTVTTADKYVAARTYTTPLDVSTSIGPKASTVDDAPMDDDEHLWATIAAADIVAGTALSIIIELSHQ